MRRPGKVNHYVRLRHNANCLISYSGAGTVWLFDQNHQSFIYHAHVHLLFAATDVAQALVNHYGGFQKITRLVIQAVVEYINVQASTTSLNVVQRVHAPNWNPSQKEHWKFVVEYRTTMKEIVMRYKNPDPTPKPDEDYYVAPSYQLITYETAMGYSNPTSALSQPANNPPQDYYSLGPSPFVPARSSQQGLPQIAGSSSQTYAVPTSNRTNTSSPATQSNPTPYGLPYPQWPR